jgi:hypothetical protein
MCLSIPGPHGLSGARPDCEASLCKLIIWVEQPSASDDGMRRDSEKRAMPLLHSACTTPTTGASESASSAQPRKKAKASKDRPSVLLHLMESQGNIQLSGSGSKGSEGNSVAWYHEEWQPVQSKAWATYVARHRLFAASLSACVTNAYQAWLHVHALTTA